MIAPIRRRVLVFAGGGTGGHIFPALALARALPSFECLFLVPRDRGDDGRIRGEFRCIPMDLPRVDRRSLLYPARLVRAVAVSRRVLRETRAAGVVGLGGYACVPASLAARTLRLPLYLMECNAVPGKATRLLSRIATAVGLGTEAAADSLPRAVRHRVTGTPLREELRVRARPEEFGLESGLPTLLVLGGSQGAQSLNTLVLKALSACAGMPFQVLHCAGEGDCGRVAEAYASLPIRSSVIDFLPDIGRAYAVADLVLGRGGASTVAECLALARPAVFVPYPWHRDRQQERNAREAALAGAARVVEEASLTPAAFRDLVFELLLSGEARRRMAEAAARIARPGAAAAMAAHLLESFGEAAAEDRCVVEIGG